MTLELASLALIAAWYAAQNAPTPPNAGSAAPVEQNLSAEVPETHQLRAHNPLVHSEFFDHFLAYEPIYFAAGPQGHGNARFEFSFMYRILNPERTNAHSSSILENFYFGFAMKSLWDLKARSSPFFDSSYRPSLFYLDDSFANFGEHDRLALQTGIEHESNGLAAPDSRSLDKLFVRPIYTHTLNDRWQFQVAPSVWAYVGGLSDNPDFADFNGHADLTLKLVDEKGLGLTTILRRGDAAHASVEIDASYPMNKLVWRKLDMYLLLQFFDGWGESLRTYDERDPTQIRLGIMFVR
jgi:outer membrane phospholipase A